MSPASMRTKLQMRISQFQGPGLELLESWHANYFEPLLEVLVNRSR